MAQNKEIDQANDRKRSQRQNLSEVRQKTGQEALRNSSQNKISLYNNQQDHKAQVAQITKINAGSGIKPTEESLANLVKSPQAQLEPIQNYQGKSLQELEAILDAHNAANPEKPKKSTSQVKEAPAQQAENPLPPRRESRYNS